MANNENTDFRKRPLEELIDQLNADGQFNARNFTNVDMQREYTDPNYLQQRGNVFFSDHCPATETRSTLPFMFNTHEDVMPTMVGMGGGNFMVYGTPSAERNRNVPNEMNYPPKTNGSLSGINNYNIDYGSNYTLFSGGINTVGASFNNLSPENSTTKNPHLIDNLVGHWGLDQSGTYTPFGTSVRRVHGQSLGEIGNERAGRKTRMVAEVRPMRPSYSDVLAKSVSNQKPGKPSDGKSRIPDVKNGKGVKPSVSRSLSGNPQFNTRHLSGTDDSTCSDSQSSLKTAEIKKIIDIDESETLTKKWVSLEDLIGGMQNDTEFLDKLRVQKKLLKKVDKTDKKNWEGCHETSNGSSNGVKGKKSTASAPKVQPIIREKDQMSGLKFESNKGKVQGDERKGTSSGQKSMDGGKTTRRNSRSVQGEKGKKGGRGRRRDGSSGWMALVANRADLVVAYVLRAVHWLLSLVLDVFALSTNLALYTCTAFWSSSVSSMTENYARTCDWMRGLSFVKRITTSKFWPFRRKERPELSSDDDDDSDSENSDRKKKKRLPGGLKHNLPLPSTGEEAMKRLLACKGKDPYSILGVSQDCTDDDIKKYYKRQAFLVHPDKNNQPGAEEAFKILVHAFDIIGEPEHRKSYDRSVEKTAQAEQAWSELSDLLAQLHKKMDYVANTLRCTNCGKRHKRSSVNRPIYAARMCAQCKIHHSVREGDIWAETSFFGLAWRYFACMDGAVYDISEWAACQGSNLKNLKANTHQVQYRIVLGKQAQKNRSQPSTTTSEPDLEEFINNLYSKPETGSSNLDGGGDPNGRNRKHKRKK